DNGDLIVAKITPCYENGKMAIVEGLAHSPAFGSTEFHVIRPGKKLLGRFLFHLLQSPAVRVAGKSRMKGAAGQKRVPTDFFKDLKLPCPPIPEQKRIAAILDAADALRAKRRETLAQLDTLLQSTFLEMFGDPVINPKGFPVVELSRFYLNGKEGTKCEPFGSALKKGEITESGVSVWNMDNIDPSGRMALPFRMWITEQKFRQLEAYAVKDGDIIISRAGTVGKMCVAKTGKTPSIISTNLIRVRLGPDLLPIYFVSLMTYCKGRVGRLKTGPDGAFTHMSTGILDKLKFPYPPLELQQRFATIVQSVEQQKSRLRAHLDELDTLFASLQARAFAGDLQDHFSRTGPCLHRPDIKVQL
ncbi:MAG: restriction endonuclease subunit S, partial [Wenzhouxiangella sp.]